MTLPTKVLLGLVLALVVGSLAYQHYANRDVPPAVRDSIAVLTASKRPDSIAHAQIVAKAETASTRSVVRSDSSRVVQQHAQADQQLAEVAAKAARESKTAQDSAEHWRVAFEAEQRRGDSLEFALEVERRASADARAAALLSEQADSASQDRLARVERLNTTIVAELERASGGCHLLPFVRCPTRKESAIGGAILTYVALRQTHALK